MELIIKSLTVFKDVGDETKSVKVTKGGIQL